MRASKHRPRGAGIGAVLALCSCTALLLAEPGARGAPTTGLQTVTMGAQHASVPQSLDAAAVAAPASRLDADSARGGWRPKHLTHCVAVLTFWIAIGATLPYGPIVAPSLLPFVLEACA